MHSYVQDLHVYCMHTHSKSSHRDTIYIAVAVTTVRLQYHYYYLFCHNKFSSKSKQLVTDRMNDRKQCLLVFLAAFLSSMLIVCVLVAKRHHDSNWGEFENA